MNKYLSSIRLEFIVGILSLVIYITILMLPLRAKQFGDGDFHIETKTIALFLHGVSSYSDLSITKAPGPVIFYLMPYFLAGSQPSDSDLWIAGVMWSALIMSGVLILLVRAIKEKYGVFPAVYFVVFLSILPIHLYYSLGILAEGPAFIGVLLILLAFIRNDGRYFYSLIIGGLTLLILSRPNAGLSIGLLSVCTLYFWWKKRDRLSYFWASLIVGCIVLGVSGFVKTLPNKRESLKQAEYLSYVMHIGRFQFRTESFDWRFWDNDIRPDSKDYKDWVNSGKQLENEISESGQTFNSVYYKWILGDIIDHPLITLKQFGIRILFGNTLQISSLNEKRFAIAGLSGNFVYWVIHSVINLINLAFFLLATRFITKIGRFREFWPLLMIVAALWIFHGVVYMEQRYLFPVRPIILFLAALSVSEVIQNRKLSFDFLDKKV